MSNANDDIRNVPVEDILNMQGNEIFKERTDKYAAEISKHNFLDRKKVEKEVKEMDFDTTININDEDDLLEYNILLDKLIACKDRITYLLNRSFADYHFLNSIYTSLFKQWVGVFSVAKSTDRREGEALYILNNLNSMVGDKEILYENLKRISFNYHTKAELVSRKITVLQQYYKLMGGYENVENKSEKKKEKRNTIVKNSNDKGPHRWGEVDFSKKS